MEKYQAKKNNSSTSNQDLEAQNEIQKLEATEKAVDLAGEIALDYFTGGKGSAVKNQLKQVPIVGDKVNKVWDGAVKEVAGVINNTPVVGDVVGGALKEADNSGVLDMAKQAKSMMNGAKGANPSGNQVPNSSNNLGNNGGNIAQANDIKGVSSASDDSSNLTGNSVTSKENSSITETSNQSSKLSNGNGFFKKSSKSGNGLTQNFTEALLIKPLKKQILISVCVIFGFILFFALLISGKDYANFDLTNNSSMSHNSTVGTGTLDSSSLSGGAAQQLQLGQSLLSILGQEKIDDWNNKIKTDVSNASSVNEAVAVAGYDLIQGALNEGIILPYFWGGGHGVIVDGVDSSIGSSKKITAGGSNLQPIGSNQPYGLDCSGFVSWAIKNGGCSNFTSLTTHGFKALPGKVNIDISKAKAGDVVVSSSHIVLVINNTGTSLQVAEAKGAKVGMVFSEYNYSYFSNYEAIDMSIYYATYC